MSEKTCETEIAKKEKENEEIRKIGAQVLDLIGKFDNVLEKRLGNDNVELQALRKESEKLKKDKKSEKNEKIPGKK